MDRKTKESGHLVVPTGSALALGDTIQDTAVLYGIDTELYTYCMVPTLRGTWKRSPPGLQPRMDKIQVHRGADWVREGWGVVECG